MGRIDHVVVGAHDLTSAAAFMLDRYGLEAQPGWDHEGAGTANMVIPIGDDQMIELLAVTDASSEHPVANHLRPRVADGHRLYNVAIHPDDVDATAERLGEPIFTMDNTDVDGCHMRWRLTGAIGMLSEEVLPFFVHCVEGREWVLGARPPEHRVEPDGIRWVEIGGDPQHIAAHLDDTSLPVRVTAGRPGLIAIGLALVDGDELEIRF